MSDVITTQDRKPQLDFDISTKQYNILKSLIACARHAGKAHLIRRVSADFFV